MTLYEISITNHTGYPFYKWEKPDKPKGIVNVIKCTRYPDLETKQEHRDFKLEAGYIAAMSIAARAQGTSVAGVRKKPISAEQFSDEGTIEDIIFDLAVDTYMNEQNLYNRMYRAIDNIISSENRKYLEDEDLSEEEEMQLKDVFNDNIVRQIIIERSTDIGLAIIDTLHKVKGQEKKLYEYGILGVGIMSSSYNVLFYRGIKTFLGLTDDDLEFPGDIPDNESELLEILAVTQIPMDIEAGESKFAYPYEKNINFIIHNFDIGPIILGVKEPFHLLVCVKAGFPSKESIDDLILGIAAHLVD